MSDAALEAENAMLRERLAKLEAARPADMEGFRQLNDAIVENRLGAFVREKAQPRWVRRAFPIGFALFFLILFLSMGHNH